MKLTLALATRGRPELLINTVKTTLGIMHEHNTRLVLLIDEDDDRTLQSAYAALGKDNPRLVWSVAPRPASLGAKYNRAMRAAPADVYATMVDYAPFATNGFDTKLLAAAQTYPDGYCILVNHLANLTLSQMNGVTHKLAERMGGICTEHFPYWFWDHWLEEIAKRIGRAVFCDVWINCTERPGTLAKREPYLWGLLFGCLDDERRAIADSIIDSPDFDETPARKVALKANYPLHVEWSGTINALLKDDPGVPVDPSDKGYAELRAKAVKIIEAHAPEGFVITPPEMGMPRKGVAFGNPEVVAMLEKWVDQAKVGKIDYAALIAIETSGKGYLDYRGTVEAEELGLEACDRLKTLVEEKVKSRMPPERNKDLDASYVCVNCCKDALAFDFMIWLAAAEMERIGEGAPGPLKVGFWAGQSGHLGLTSEYRKRMFESVVRPSLPFVGAVEEPMGCLGRTNGYRLGEVVRRFRAGQPVPVFKPSTQAWFKVAEWFPVGKRPIVITLREFWSWPHRNSNLDAWMQFAEHLQGQGEQVIFVRDTIKANEPLNGFATCPDASTNIDIRLALYQRARANLLVSNGPASLLLFSGAPWLMLTQHDDSSEYHPETSGWWRKSGLEPGEQYPWCRPNQREVFSKDSFEEILAAWDDYRGAL